MSKEPNDQERAGFLWPCDEGSVEEAGYEVINANTEDYRKQWWEILLQRMERRIYKGMQQ